MKPTRAATLSGWPDSHRPITAPTSASGMFTMISADSAADLYRLYSTTNISVSDTMDSRPTRREASS